MKMTPAEIKAQVEVLKVETEKGAIGVPVWKLDRNADPKVDRIVPLIAGQGHGAIGIQAGEFFGQRLELALKMLKYRSATLPRDIVETLGVDVPAINKALGLASPAIASPESPAPGATVDLATAMKALDEAAGASPAEAAPATTTPAPASPRGRSGGDAAKG